MRSAAGGGWLVWLAVACLALTACGEVPGGTAADPTAEPGDRYTNTISVAVIEAPGHLPQLCMMGATHSGSPQCVPEGIDLIGWDWTGLDGSDTTGAGFTWGFYDLVGTYDGTRFTITESPTPGGRLSPELARATVRTFAFDSVRCATAGLGRHRCGRHEGRGTERCHHVRRGTA